ncbi:hypothetical protein NKZ05_11670 [Stutzerimonas stutzeri]|uniref:hypothetical protein n=1 Tax=Stutzerimonas stutzeri TaxID=316 RepID=UPI00387DC9F9
MERTLVEMREERLQKLFSDCQQQVISQIIGPFGLSMAMFEDRNGGNVTTVHNFVREPDTGDGSNSYVAEKDQASYSKSREEYSANKKDLGSIPASTIEKVETASGGIDGYTNKELATSTSKTNRQYDADIDHVNSKKSVWKNKAAHLAFETGTDLDRMKEVVHSEENLVVTDKSLNRSKGEHSLEDFAQTPNDGVTNADRFELDQQSCATAQNRADQHLNSSINKDLLRKQGTELLQTGGKQAALMGLRQSLGLLLTELVNGLFNEFKILIKAGVEAGKTLFEEIKERLQRVIAAVVKKIPAAASQAFQGGVSGFMSNLITFLINNFLSTAKRFVTIIREGLLGLVKALKMIMFPPKGMTSSEALQEGLKVLTAVVVTSVGFLLQESVATFLKTLPFLIPVADAVSGVLIGIMTGLLSAFLAYQLDNVFARYRYAYDEKLLDAIATDAKLTEKMAGDLVEASEASLSSIAKYTESIKSYEKTGELLGAAGRASQAVVSSLAQAVESAKTQVAETKEMISYLDETNTLLDDFFGKKATE